MREYYLELSAEGDAGYTFEFRCPECGDNIFVSQHPWSNDPKCKCGEVWQLELCAVSS